MRAIGGGPAYSKVALLVAALLPVLAGCDAPASRVEGGPEMRFVTSKPPTLIAEPTGPKSLLPLTPGTSWSMLGILPESLQPGVRPVLHPIEMRVVSGPTNTFSGVGGGSLIELRKDGQPWRREVYRGTKTELSLMAAADGTNPFMVYSPAIPLARYPLQEGQSLPWQGTFNYKGQSFPATAYSRISAIESVATRKGKQTAFRIDTLIVLYVNGEKMTVSAVRWFTPGIGFVRRAFVDHSQNIYAELQQANLPVPITADPSGQ